MAKVKFTTNIDEELLTEIKILALKEKRNVNEIIEEQLKNYLNKKGSGNMLNKKWGELSEDKKEELLDESYPIDGITGNKPKESGECIVDFSNGYSVAGHVEITDVEDIITIEDDAVIYKSDN